VADRMIAKGVEWKLGKVFFGDRQVYQFDLLPEGGHKCPAFINLQQYYLEDYMVQSAAENPLIDIRWKHKLLSLRQEPDHAVLTVETPDGVFKMTRPIGSLPVTGPIQTPAAWWVPTSPASSFRTAS
jgi:3-(3-hydroxy-phenyl)propionate hydroxylase